MRTRVRLSALALSLGMMLSACTDTADDSTPADETLPPAGTSAPDSALTLIADSDPAAAAISTSRALFDSANVVVVARVGDQVALTLGASAAVALGAPLLLSRPAAPSDSGDPSPPAEVTDPVVPESTTAAESGATTPAEAGEPLQAEFRRLRVSHVLAVGTDAAQDIPSTDGVQTVAVLADPTAVGAAIGAELAATPPVEADDLAVAFAALDPAAPVALLPSDEQNSAANPSSDPQASGERSEMPHVNRPTAVTGTLLLATNGVESLAGIATARAAGVPVQVASPDQLDPRSSGETVDALSSAGLEAVIVIGSGYAAQAGLDWKLATARTGAQLPGGGQLLFPEHMFVGLYGYTEGGSLGVLGEQDVTASVQRATETAGTYAELVPTTVVPMFEIIATVASEFAGPDGNYSTESPIAQLQPWVDAAGAAGIYVVLDLQPGRTDFLTQAQAYEPLLRLPFVGLALDPEWRLRSNEVHLTQIGTVSIEEVNSVVTWLAELTRANALPQKLLVLHQFLPAMIQDRALLDTSREELAVLIHVDGKGSQPDKQATWASLHEDPPAGVYWGWKNFVDEDLPMLTPEETIDQALPTPQLITYQ